MSAKLTRLTARLLPRHKVRQELITRRELVTLEPPRRRGQWLVDERRRLFRNAPLCVGYKAKPDHIAAATQRDHIVPLWEGGADVEANTQGLCDDCHDRKSSDEAARRGAHR